MCGCKDCQGITLLKGTDGVGIVSITAQEDGTFVFLYSDGTTYTSPDLTGPQGEPGIDGTDGAPGTNGTNGSNAFKFSLQTTSNLDRGVITIPYATWSVCSTIPEGCLSEGTLFAAFVDLHIQVWLQNNEFPIAVNDPWILGNINSVASINIDPVSGEIKITFVGITQDIKVRIVILA